MTELAHQYFVPPGIRLFRWTFRPLFRGLFHLLSEVRVIGAANIPKSGAYIIAINHTSHIEPPFVIAFWPVPPEAIGAIDIWQRRGQSTLARFYGGIQVHRGEYDRKVIEQMRSALNSGRPLLIAPEGRRSHTPGMQRAYPGVAYIVDKVGMPVVPVGLVGGGSDFVHNAFRMKRQVLEMHVGEPFRLPKVEGRGEERRASLQRNTDYVMYRIAELLPPEYHGVYALSTRPTIETS
jgi:1-acyl-sn-glycerol-3-phosphate acyltransferase